MMASEERSFILMSAFRISSAGLEEMSNAGGVTMKEPETIVINGIEYYVGINLANKPDVAVEGKTK